MSTITFDTLKYAQRMRAVGFTDEQANEQANAIAEIIDEKVMNNIPHFNINIHRGASKTKSCLSGKALERYYQSSKIPNKLSYPLFHHSPTLKVSL